LRIAAALALTLLSGCGQAAPSGAPQRRFPAADRPVAAIVSSRWQNEDDRDAAGEATEVLALAGVKPGMTVADIGAGEGYYTIRLAQAVGPQGRVLAEDIVPAYRDALAARVQREGLDTVSVTLGLPADPKLPGASFDRVFLIHMYHEIAEPYELLWRLRPSLKPGGRIVVVDADRPTGAHGTPPRLLDCEFAAVGYARVGGRPLPRADAYVALYEARGPAVDPAAIRPCQGQR